ncbi:EamA-like transporter family protein [compost metagenome]
MWFLLAAASAISFGLRGILYQWTSQRPIKRNILLMGVYLSGTLITLAANGVIGQVWTFPVLVGIWMGLFSFISNAAMYKGFSVGKASVVAIFLGLPPVVVALLAYVIWGESLNIWQLCAFLFIVIGILLIRYSNDLSLSNLKGAGWGILTMLFFAFTDLLSKKATLIEAATLPTLTLMYATGMLLFGLSWFLEPYLEARARAKASKVTKDQVAAAVQVGTIEGNNATTAAVEVPKPTKPTFWPVRKTLIWGLIVGLTNVAGMLFVMPAYKLGVTGLVSAISAMNVVLVLVYARFGLKEKFSRLEVIGLGCTFIGIIVIRLSA